MKTFLRVLRKVTRHPLNQDHKLRAVWRLLRWQLGSRLLRCPIVYEWISGARFIVSKGEIGMTGNIYTGLFDLPDMAYLLHVLREDDLFVDVGAYAGCYTLLASKCAGSRTIAFEALPETYTKLVDNIRLNHVEDRVVAHNLAMGESSGELSLTVHQDSMNHALAASEADDSAIKVPVRTLDSVLGGESPTVLKIDVEGYEWPVLSGALKTLEQSALHSIIMELNGSGQRYGYDEDQIVELMGEYGFQAYEYEPFQRVLRPLEGKNRSEGNTIFIRNINHVKARVAEAVKFIVLNHEI